MRGRIFVLFSISFFASQAQFKNIRITNIETGYSVSISAIVNPKNTANSSANIGGRLFYTQDAGATWNESGSVTASNGSSTYLTADAKGHTYFFWSAKTDAQGVASDAGIHRILVKKSEDGGNSWQENGFIAADVTKDQLYPRVTIHPRKHTLLAVWTQFDKLGLKEAACQSLVYLGRSGGGKKWSPPIQVSRDPGDCMDGENRAGGATPVISMDDKAYIAWSNHETIFFDRSYDGTTWLGEDLALTKQPGGWSMPVPGIGEVNGMPVLMIDNSTNPYHGSIYIVWADQRNGKDDTDIWIMRSSNRGDNWTQPLRVNQDAPGKHQFMPWSTIDQATGHVYIVFYDRREHDDAQTDVYIAYSVDGGNSFKEKKISENVFTPTEGKPFSTQNAVAAHKGVITPVWTRSDHGQLSVWSAVINESDLLNSKQ
jgi:hypothetical protein